MGRSPTRARRVGVEATVPADPMPKLRNPAAITARLYTRTRVRGGPMRYYADFRDFRDVGGDQEALIAPGERTATTDAKQAKELVEARLAALEELRAKLPAGPVAARAFGPFAASHLSMKATNEDAEERWLAAAQGHLEVARDFFGDTRDLATITVGDVNAFVVHLRARENGRGGVLGGGAVNQYLNSLSNLFKRAISEGLLPLGGNPVQAMMTRPKMFRRPTAWLEIPEMAGILDWSRTYRAAREDLALPFVHELLMTYAHTGAREDEVLGLERGDVNLERRVISIRENSWRGLKNKNATRTLPIPSDLHAVLEAYERGPHAPKGRLYFPSYVDGVEQKITDLRRILDKAPMPARFRRPRTAAELKQEAARREKKIGRLTGKTRTGPRPQETLEELRAPIDPTIVPPLRTRMLRHTWCAARLQTTDGGKSVADYTVMSEMGHRDLEMIKKVYGHLGTFRHRGEEVSYQPVNRGAPTSAACPVAAPTLVVAPMLSSARLLARRRRKPHDLAFMARGRR